MNKRELELYIHIPFCARKCSYCDFLSFAAPERVYREYMDKLIEEICGQGPNFQEYRRASPLTCFWSWLRRSPRLSLSHWMQR